MAVRPNLIVILIDDLRFDEFGAGGHPYMQTPHINRLAHEGALFTNAFHTTLLCSPNRASILTGQYASRHGIIDNVGRDVASHRLPNYMRVLQQLGYETVHIGKWHSEVSRSQEAHLRCTHDAPEPPRDGVGQWSARPKAGRSEA